jgi:hypothetical protein
MIPADLVREEKNVVLQNDRKRILIWYKTLKYSQDFKYAHTYATNKLHALLNFQNVF